MYTGKAAVFYRPNDLRVEKKRFSSNNLVRINSCAVCSYDIRVFINGHKKVTPPVILGHEISGITKSNIKLRNKEEIKKDTKVVISPLIPCLNCFYCNNENFNLCSKLQELGSSRDGGYSQYLEIPKETIYINGIIPYSKIQDDEATLAEPLSCCLNSIKNMNTIEKNEKILIIGDGPIGLIHLKLLKMYGCKVMIIGKIPQRMNLAREFNADMVVNFDSKEITDKICKFTNGIGFKKIVVATSSLNAIKKSFTMCSKNSYINIFAGMPRNKILIDPNLIHYNQITISGSFSATPIFLKKAINMLERKKISLSKLITNKFNIQQINTAFEYTKKFISIKNVINDFE